MKIGSLCTGYGGLDMAVEAYFGAETVWTAEFDKFASIVVKERIKKPNYGDIKLIDWEQLEPVDIITAGYPCQPFSVAGKRKGENDKRHVWPHIIKGISILRPSIVILENVKGHLNLGFDRVLADLTSEGYDCRWQVVRASDIGAPHQRSRLFIVANLRNYKLERKWNMQELGWRYPSLTNMHLQTPPHPLDQGKLRPQFTEYMMGLPAGWVTDLPISRRQQFKIIGNGVVPQQAYYALKLLCDVNHSPYIEIKD